MEGRTEDPFVVVDDEEKVRELLNLTMRGESEKLDELCEKAAARLVELNPVGPNAHQYFKELEHWMRRAFKCALDTELTALEDMAMANMDAVARKLSNHHVEELRCIESAKSWVRPRAPKPPFNGIKHQVPPA